MASITSWIRIELRARDPQLAPGVEARLHDPLWLIGRQWQLGELAGHDTGSAIAASARLEVARVDAVRGAGEAWVAYDPEAEAPGAAALATALPADLAERARTGRRLLRALTAAGEPDAATWCTRQFPIAADPAAIVDDADRRFAAVIAGRLPDGIAAAETFAPHLAAGDLPAGLGIPTTDLAGVSVVCRSWLAGVHRRGSTIGAWRPSELRHRFALRAGGLRLPADDHRGGAIAWHDVDAAVEPASPGSPAALLPSTVTVTGIPARVRYRGMPARRYWELEDAAVFWPGIAAGPGDVGRVLLVEFAQSYSDHWLSLPVVLPAATVARVGSLVVTDTFGRRALVRAATELDGPSGPWRFCELVPRAGSPGGLVFLPPVPCDLVGVPLAAVELGRDDTANVVWAIDRVRRGADGRPREVPAPASAAPAPRSADAPALAYRLGPAIADPFHPYRTIVRPDGVALVRAIAPGQPASVDRADLPGVLVPGALAVSAVRVVSSAHVARSPDGGYHVHTELDARFATPGPTPALAFDQLEDGGA